MSSAELDRITFATRCELVELGFTPDEIQAALSPLPPGAKGRKHCETEIRRTLALALREFGGAFATNDRIGCRLHYQGSRIRYLVKSDGGSVRRRYTLSRIGQRLDRLKKIPPPPETPSEGGRKGTRAS